ncbi:hypothetical protein MO327_10560 [Xanthomonas translucens]|uniref:hypothetical protein n=1 Tax=Xanthomonas campestris pv. translucens TaxID=343 RepID=UPI00272CC78C|nr:hypothetical protein [Xanthomonas translucens]WLA10715.1 hypothetical protein MO327_10560 [Xanthomonas translucens]
MKITIECVGKALGVLVNSGAVFPSFHQRWGDLSGVPRNVGRVSAANGVYVCWNGVISSAAISWICKGDGQPRPRSGTRPISHNVYRLDFIDIIIFPVVIDYKHGFLIPANPSVFDA